MQTSVSWRQQCDDNNHARCPPQVQLMPLHRLFVSWLVFWFSFKIDAQSDLNIRPSGQFDKAEPHTPKDQV